MSPVICPSCRTPISLPPNVPLANMLCPRCKNPLQGATGGTSTAAPAAPTSFTPQMGRPQSYPTAPVPPSAPVASSPVRPLAASTSTGLEEPKRYGKLTALLIAIILLLGFGADVFLLLSRGANPEKDRKSSHGTEGGGGSTEGPKHSGETPELARLYAAIDRGVAYLRERVLVGDTIYYPNDEGGGSALGPRALAGLTLLECGVPSGDAAILRVAEEVRRDGPKLRYTYSMCLAILFLDRLDRDYKETKGGSLASDKDLIRDLAQRLINAQNSRGGWGYNCELDGAGPGLGRSDYTDNSINQFATLALWAARRHGVRVERSLEAVEKRYRAIQNADGSWGYHEKANDLKAATTCAGLMGVAVGRGLIDDKEALKRLPPLVEDEAVKKGLKFIAGSIGKASPKLSKDEVEKRRRHAAEMNALNRKWHSHPESRAETEERIRAIDNAEWLRGTFLDVDAWGDLYFLWSVERVGVIFSLNRFGELDWYEWGVPLILAQQRADGSWHDRFPGVPDTCFALLFLRRANVAQDLTERLQRSASPSEAPPTPMP